MKLAPREVTRFLSKPLSVRVILVYGEDRGSVTDLAKQIASALVPDLNDPFSVALLDADSLKDPSRLHDELFGLPPLGGVKLVRLRDATDRHTAVIEPVLTETGPAGRHILLIEAGDLAFRSSLRKLCEGHAAAVAIGCGGDSAGDVEGFIREVLRGDGLTINPDAVSSLARRLGGDRALLRRALEALALYKQDDRETEITVRDVSATTGDSESLGLDAVLDALLTGSRAAIDRAVTKALEAGTTPVGIIRGALRTFQRIHMVSLMMERGTSPDQVLNGLIPPLPYSARGPFLAACRRWTPAMASRALALLNEGEARCKTTGLPEAVICAEILLRLPELTGKPRAA